MTYMIDQNTSIHSVDLNVINLDLMTSYYTEKIGLSVLEQSDNYASLGIKEENLVLLNLIKIDSDETPTKKGGLFHTAFLLPSRKDLGNVLYALLKKELAIEGASDHGYSEALYLTDPEGNGIEIYWDKPMEEWDILEDGTIKGITAEMDADGVLASRDDQLVTLFPKGTRLGHVHLSVINLQDSQAFYTEIVGMQLKYVFGSQARFIAAGEYHHHIGMNTWLGNDLAVRNQYDRGLTRFTLSVTTTEELKAFRQHLNAHNVKVIDETETFITITDPNGIHVTVTTS